jgi:hypothetical protein
MCDYSLQHVRSRPAKVGDQLTKMPQTEKPTDARREYWQRALGEARGREPKAVDLGQCAAATTGSNFYWSVWARGPRACCGVTRQQID